jgi:hypothetical protein
MQPARFVRRVRNRVRSPGIGGQLGVVERVRTDLGEVCPRRTCWFEVVKRLTPTLHANFSKPDALLSRSPRVSAAAHGVVIARPAMATAITDEMKTVLHGGFLGPVLGSE